VATMLQKDVARRLGVHPNTVANMLNDGRLTSAPVTGSGAFQAPTRRVEAGSVERLVPGGANGRKWQPDAARGR
jgi:transposase